jgi:lipid-A-disaccharide synthase
MRSLGVPTVYLVAPQAWAWRQGRVKQMRTTIGKLLCLFPFEESFFRSHGVNADYIGHPLARIIRPARSKADFVARHKLDPGKPIVALCPGSRPGEIARHLPVVVEAVHQIAAKRPASFLLAAPLGFSEGAGGQFFRERISSSAIQVIEGETWDILSYADVVLAASGTVTMEAALLGTPMVTFYRVTGLSWLMGRFLVRTPFFSMPNLIAGRALVPELMQNEMTAERLSGWALRLLENEAERSEMQRGLAGIRERLASAEDPMIRAARIIREFVDEHEKKQ